MGEKVEKQEKTLRYLVYITIINLLNYSNIDWYIIGQEARFACQMTDELMKCHSLSTNHLNWQFIYHSATS